MIWSVFVFPPPAAVAVGVVVVGVAVMAVMVLKVVMAMLLQTGARAGSEVSGRP